MEIANFGYWVYFGGILYKRGRGNWGMNMKRARMFLKGQATINTEVVFDPLTGEHKLSEQKYIYQLKGLKDFLDSAGNFVPEYLEMEEGRL